MIIEFNLENDKDCAFYALYAGLRMFFEKKKSEDKPDELNIAGAEAYCMLQDMKKQFPKEYQEAKEEYELVNNISNE